MMSRRNLLTGALAVMIGSRAAALPGGLGQRPPARPVPGAAQVVARAGLAARVSYALLDPGTGVLHDGAAAFAPVTPASTLKVVTALYALDRLGPSFRFRTRILRAGDMIILAGGGDPLLSTDDLERLAGDLVASGQGSLARFAVWGGALPRLSEIAPGQADHLAYNPAMSGMILNFNRVHLGWRQSGGDYRMSLEARAEAHSPRAYTITAAPGAQVSLFSYGAGDGRESWTVSRAAMGKAGSRWLPVRKPELYAGDVFQTLCRAKGLVLPAPEVIGALPVATQEIAALDSPALRDILRGMLKYSTNLTAEVVGLRASGASGPGASARAMRDWLVAQGLGVGFSLADHSGLSADSRVTAGGMARILAGPGLSAGLPDLLKPEVPPPGRDVPAPDVVAKTGTLNFVSNLAGYARDGGGPWLAFAVMCTDGARHAATRGAENPAGAAGWTRRAKTLQHDLVLSWLGRFGQDRGP
ncbi:D-alanyl-D-alanine carboxypeptidase [Paracoccus sp. (in: a-proteobacteria)]|uniref:D-alanyl-D-alanine carboxypeptidase n=1 Tax=Paracoccus sp. TaxID=267 RepID=UPI003A859DF5